MPSKFLKVSDPADFSLRIQRGRTTLTLQRGEVLFDTNPGAAAGETVVEVDIPNMFITANTPEPGKSTLSLLLNSGIPFAEAVTLPFKPLTL